ncbi:MAG: HlyD family efflux transporter periplasmic adaptor subunit, partial [Gemmatimonas sp.]
MFARAFRDPSPASLLLLALALLSCRASEAENTAVGTMEMVEVNVGPLQPARVVRVAANEGDAVHVGDTLVLFSLPTIAASEAQAEARAAAARETARDLLRGARPAEIAVAEAALRAADAEAERFATEFVRLERLASNNDISKAALDDARMAERTSAARRDAARESLALLRAGTRADQRRAAEAEARAAAAGVESVRATARDLVLLSPIDGVVTSRNAEPGEVMAAGQSALTLGTPARPWARVYVSQFVLLAIKVGDTLSAHLDGDSTT